VHANRKQECNDLEDNIDVFELHSGLASILPCGARASALEGGRITGCNSVISG
jgi:hypothetical protein